MQNGKYEVASVIVKAGADIEIKNEHGKTALGMALDSNNVPMIKELLLNGANPKNVDSKKTSHEARLIFAEYNADPLKWLVDNKASPEVIAKFSPAKEESLAPEKDKDSGHAARVKINQAESYSERMVGEKNKTEVIGK
jgi:ankyrin repeat protein